MTSQPQRLTAAQIEDVRRLIRSAHKTGVAASVADRLQNSLFPETEPADSAVSVKPPRIIGVNVDVLLAFVQNDWDSVMEILEAIAGLPINNKAAEIARSGFNRTWGDKLGVVINANRKAELNEPAMPAEKETKAEAIEALTEAIRFTVEYVGMKMLSPIEGWDWYDALVKYAPAKAQSFLDAYTPPTDPGPATGNLRRDIFWTSLSDLLAQHGPYYNDMDDDEADELLTNFIDGIEGPERDVAASPVVPAPTVPAPTETEWATWAGVPEGVIVKAANGERFRKTGYGVLHLYSNGVGDCCKITGVSDLHPAPFVAVEPS